MERRKIRVAISHGDINGIGYEVLLKALMRPGILDLFTPIVYGSAKVAAFWKKTLDLNTPMWNQISAVSEARDGVVNVINCVDDGVKVEPGVQTDEAGLSALKALAISLDDVRAGLADLLVTNPITKSSMPENLFPYKGHTDFLIKHAGKAINGEDPKGLMILVAGEVRIALTTTHCAIKEVASKLSIDLIKEKLILFNQSLKEDFGIRKPRIAVLSLNPHCGDSGLMGDEEISTIDPAIKQAFEDLEIMAFGPYAADGFWGSDAYHHFDGILAMYHDQGLAPFKALYMDRGVNITAGLKIVRTSPDHGTGYDIAGKGVANESSLVEAICLGIDIYRKRSEYKYITRNPLRKVYFNRSGDEELPVVMEEED